MTELAVLDRAHVRAIFEGGAADTLPPDAPFAVGTLDMLDFFLETTGPALERSAAALAAGQAGEARSAAHASAGAARTAGALALAAACSALEDAIAEGRGGDAPGLARAALDAFAVTERAVRALRIPERDPGPPERDDGASGPSGGSVDEALP